MTGHLTNFQVSTGSPKLHLTLFQSYDGCNAPAVICSYAPRLSPSYPTRTCSAWTASICPLPITPFEAFQTSYWGMRTGHVSQGCTKATQMWPPFSLTCLCAGAKWQLPDKPLHFAALTESSQYCRNVQKSLVNEMHWICRCSYSPFIS